MSLSTLPANIYSTLSGHAGLQALVANTDSPATYRIDPVQRGQAGTDPYVVYEQVWDSAFNHLSNSGGGGKRNARIQISSFAPTHKGAYAVAEQARLAMRDATLFSSSYISTVDYYEPDTKLYAVITDYSVMTL